MKIIEYCFFSGGFWVRFFGYGVRVINRDKITAPFYIRNGYMKEYKCWRYGVSMLKPIKNN